MNELLRTFSNDEQDDKVRAVLANKIKVKPRICEVVAINVESVPFAVKGDPVMRQHACFRRGDGKFDKHHTCGKHPRLDASCEVAVSHADWSEVSWRYATDAHGGHAEALNGLRLFGNWLVLQPHVLLADSKKTWPGCTVR